MPGQVGRSNGGIRYASAFRISAGSPPLGPPSRITLRSSLSLVRSLEKMSRSGSKPRRYPPHARAPHAHATMQDHPRRTEGTPADQSKPCRRVRFQPSLAPPCPSGGTGPEAPADSRWWHDPPPPRRPPNQWIGAPSWVAPRANEELSK